MASNEASKKVDTARGAPRGAGAPKRAGPVEFLSQVRDEGRKVTWPSRRETTVTTIMVFVMVVLASVFFTVVDQALRYGVGLILGL